jgi:hypothetical protein
MIQIYSMATPVVQNLFVSDVPRLSVDIDLTCLPVQSRAKPLAAFDAAMKRVAVRIAHAHPRHAIGAGPKTRRIN